MTRIRTRSRFPIAGFLFASFRPAVVSIRRSMIKARIKNSIRTCDLMHRRIQNDVVASRLYPEKSKELGFQIEESRAVIHAEQTRQADLNSRLFTLK